MTSSESSPNRPRPSPATAIIVGAGILGAAFAYFLSRAGINVTVLDATGPHTGASGGSWAWINAAAADRPDYRALRDASVKRYRELDRELGGAFPIDWTGTLLCDPTLTSGLSEDDPGYKRLKEDELQTVLPFLKSPPREAWLSANDALLDGVGAVNVLLNASNAVVQTGRPVTKILFDGVRVSGVETPFGPIVADITVLAGGTGTAPLLSPIAQLPTQNRAGLLAITTPISDRLPLALWTDTIHVKQMRDNRLMIGEAQHSEGALANASALAETLLRQTEAMLAVGPLSLDQVTIATRPIPADGFPVIGTPETVSGLYVAMMHSGMTLAAIAGALGAQEIVTGKPQDLFASFRIERFKGH